MLGLWTSVCAYMLSVFVLGAFGFRVRVRDRVMVVFMVRVRVMFL